MKAPDAQTAGDDTRRQRDLDRITGNKGKDGKVKNGGEAAVCHKRQPASAAQQNQYIGRTGGKSSA